MSLKYIFHEQMFLGLKKRIFFDNKVIFYYKSLLYQMIMRIYWKDSWLKQSMGSTQIIESTVQHNLALSKKFGDIGWPAIQPMKRGQCRAHAAHKTTLLFSAVYSTCVNQLHPILPPKLFRPKHIPACRSVFVIHTGAIFHIFPERGALSIPHSKPIL